MRRGTVPFAGNQFFSGKDGAVFHDDGCASGALALGVGVGGQGAGPGDVAVAGWIEGIAAFVKGPASASVDFSQGKVIGGNILVAPGEALF